MKDGYLLGHQSLKGRNSMFRWERTCGGSWPGALFIPMLLSTVAGYAGIESISPDWQPTGAERIRVAAANASSYLSEAYSPDRVFDGDRQRTKWVSPVRPTEASPQWITLTLEGGARKVQAVAVYGERPDNDGILDAEIQVAVGEEFQTVASIRDARWPCWLASFEPVMTAKVRLCVLRSGGPTDHTDVWEMEAYGPPMSIAELKASITTSLNRLPKSLAEVSDLVLGLNLNVTNLPSGLRGALNRVGYLHQRISISPALSSDSRDALLQLQSDAQEAERLVRHVSDRLRRHAAAKPELASAPERIRAEGRSQLKSSVRAEGNVGGRTGLANSEVAIWLDGPSGTWNAVWRDGIEAVVAGVEISVEIDGTDVANGPAPTELRHFQDPLGSGKALVQVWRNKEIRVEREIRAYDGRGVIGVGGRLTNESSNDVLLGTVDLVRTGGSGGWSIGNVLEAPAAVYLQRHSLLRSKPFVSHSALQVPQIEQYRSSGVLALVGRDPGTVLVVGYVRAEEAGPDIAASFELDRGGTALSASSRFLGRVLGPGESIELNHVCIAAGTNAFDELESYGEMLAQFSSHPVYTGATSLWCSWYAHRMGMTEDRVLANADVAARHFRPLGLEIMQLDHGWQRGDITGDWVPNERFPHGLAWLAAELKKRHGLRLGVWISPTDVAETSDLFRQHPDWMLRGADGKPRVNWQWYWKPNPNCYELDATHPDAYRFIVDTFKRLTDEGVSYFKIDFIAAAGGEHFVQHDRKATRGWSVLRRSMEAVREGAGGAAWIRYCQTPPILSAGLASSAYGGDDTLDAGISGRFDVLRDNAHALAAGWWLNDRPYHREVCDMSVRMQGSIEEVRVRAAIMTLAGCSISWSDELCYLPPSRIRLMQQCLPPGNPPMRPADIFEREVPSVWLVNITNTFENWVAAGLFNFGQTPEKRMLSFEQIGLDPKAEYAVFEFWEERFLGVCRGCVELELPPESSRIVSIRRVTGVPQVIGSDMHLLQGWHEIKQLGWNPTTATLSGIYRRMPGIHGKAFILVPDAYQPKFEFPLTPASARLTHVGGPLWMQEIEFVEAENRWSIPFGKSP